MTRRSIYYASFNRDANFYRYFNGEKVASCYVCGADVSINGVVSVDEFNKLLDEVLMKDNVKREVIPCRENYFSGWGNMESNYLINKTSGFSSIAKKVAEKVNKETYKMTRSEYGYNYFPERF